MLCQTERGRVDQGSGAPWFRWVAVGAVESHEVVRIVDRTNLLLYGS